MGLHRRWRVVTDATTATPPTQLVHHTERPDSRATTQPGNRTAELTGLVHG